MSSHQMYEQYMREEYGLHVLWVHEAYWDVVVHALIRVGASFSWLPSGYAEKPYVFWIKESPASTWQNEWFDGDLMQRRIKHIRDTLTYPYPHLTPDGELIRIDSVSPDGEYKIERC